MFKRTKVVMLIADDKKSNIFLHQGKLFYYKEDDSIPKNSAKNQHIYFLSDEVPIDGDWCLSNLNELVQFKKNYNNTLYGKIIATTDNSLKIGEEPKKWISAGGQGGQLSVHWDMWNKSQLPQPSQSFIEKFVEEYNEGNKIEYVDVEYEWVDNCENIPGVGDYYELKIDNKDNTITIKKIKDSWSREEVIDLLKKYTEDADEETIKSWIDKNL